METQMKAAIVVAIATIIAAAMTIYGPSKNAVDDTGNNIVNNSGNNSRNTIVNTADKSINLNVVQNQYTENVISYSKKDDLRSTTDLKSSGDD
jgi:hypothetical protein